MKIARDFLSIQIIFIFFSLFFTQTFQILNEDCTQLSLDNGQIIGCTSDDTKIEIFCNNNYVLRGSAVRICIDGQWTGQNSTCVAANDGDYRLAKQYITSPIEIYKNNSWHYLCYSPDFDQRANALCNSNNALFIHNDYIENINLVTEITEKQPSYVTSLSQGFSFQSVTCKVAGVTCGPVNSIIKNAGKLIWNNNADICAGSLDNQTAKLYCKLNNMTFSRINSFSGAGTPGSVGVTSVNCYAYADNFDDCTIETNSTGCNGKFADIKCINNPAEGDLRLVDIGSIGVGRLQIYLNGIWGDICGETFYDTEGELACRQLGYSYSTVLPIGLYGMAIANISNKYYSIEKLICTGTEDKLINCNIANSLSRCGQPDRTTSLKCSSNKDCCDPGNNTNSYHNGTRSYPHNTILKYRCTDAYVIQGEPLLVCDGGIWSAPLPKCIPVKAYDVRLLGNDPSSGELQVYANGMWNFVCDNGITMETGTIICNQLGYTGIQTVTNLNFFDSTIPSITSIGFKSVTCGSAATHLSDCSLLPTSATSCSIKQVSGLSCGIYENQLRLAGSTIRGRGRVEIFHDNEWGTVCDLFYYSRAAELACKQLGYATGTTILSYQGNSEFGSRPEDVLAVSCFRTAASFSDCTFEFYPTFCNNPLYAQCRPEANNTIRLAGSESTISEGQVQIYKDYNWLSICGDEWDLLDGRVLCQSLGWEGVDNVDQNYGRAISPLGFAISNVMCNGIEKQISSCMNSFDVSSCDRNNVASVKCSLPDPGTIRAISPTYVFNGSIQTNIEIFIEGMWRSVCVNKWGIEEANVTCAYLGYELAVSTNVINAGIIQYRVSNFMCIGNETNITQCTYDIADYYLGTSSCRNYQRAGVSCRNYTSGEIRLDPTSAMYSDEQVSGSVQIMQDNIWKPICNSQWNDMTALVACRELKQQELIFADNSYILISGNQYGVDLQCNGSENLISSCIITNNNVQCPDMRGAGVICKNSNGEIRLVSGNDTSGHVQINYDNRWGNVCDDGWTLVDAEVACRQLNFSGAISATQRSAFGYPSTVFYWLDDVACLGNETRLDQCPASDWGINNCFRSELAGVTCTPRDCSPLLPIPNSEMKGDLSHGSMLYIVCNDGYKLKGNKAITCSNEQWIGQLGYCVAAQEYDIRLTDTASSNEGHVQILIQNTWQYVCDDNWNIINAGVVCRQLNLSDNAYSYSLASFYFGNMSQSNVNIALNSVSCIGDETSLIQCPANMTQQCSAGELAGVKCVGDYGSLRLFNGDSENSGELQAFINGAWYSVCSKFFSTTSQAASCSQLGFLDSGAVVKHIGNSTVQYGISCNLGGVCSFYNVSLCTSAIYLTCNNSATCEVRIQGTFDNEGAIEIWNNGRWGGICYPQFSFQSANIVCLQLGWEFGANDIMQVTGSYSNPIPFNFGNITCLGTETSICECQKSTVIDSNCVRNQALGVSCRIPADGTLRLYMNTLEIFHIDRWGAVCDDLWSTVGANVACKQLGYARVNSTQIFVLTYHEFWLDDVRCVGNEEYLSNCSRSDWGIDNCVSREGIYLDCEDYVDGEFRLVNKEYNYQHVEFKLQLRRNSTWTEICPMSLTNPLANQLCVKLGYKDSDINRIITYPASNNSDYNFVSISNCLAFDNILSDCQLQNELGCMDGLVLGLYCKTFEDDVRLVDGGNYYGSVEIYHEGIWGAICDDLWDINDATVVCKQLGYTGADRALTKNRLNSTTIIWLDDVKCEGNERYLSDCTSSDWGRHNCYIFEGAGVFCTPKSCEQIPSVMNGYYKSDFTGPYPHGTMVILYCNSGYTAKSNRVNICEDGVWNHIGLCRASQDYDIRLVDSGDSINEGNIQVYRSNLWGYVCDAEWAPSAGEIACRWLGFHTLYRLTSNSLYSKSTDVDIRFDSIVCDSNKYNNFSSCHTFPTVSSTCPPHRLAGVVCDYQEGSVLLSNNTEGVLTVFYDDQYFSVCSDQWTLLETSVACRQLGYSFGEITQLGFTSFSFDPSLTVICNGSEDKIIDCVLSTTSLFCFSLGLSIRCYDPPIHSVRLVDGDYVYEGLVEEYIGNNTWGSICSNGGWDSNAAAVVCRQLKWNGVTEVLYDLTTPSYTGIGVTGIRCTGNETSLEECQHSHVGDTCSRDAAAGVRCVPPANGTLTIREDNILQIFINNKLGYICDDSFGLLDAIVACRHLGYKAVKNFYVRQSILSKDFLLDELSCDGTEQYLYDCPARPIGQHNCQSNEAVGLECTPYETGDIRLGAYNRLEVMTESGWSEVFTSQCGGSQIASVTCRQLGLIPLSPSYQLTPQDAMQSNPIFVVCDGSELAISNCTTRMDTISTTNDVISVKCRQPGKETFRLTQVSPGSDYQFVEVYYENFWRRICGRNWDIREAVVACRQFHFNSTIGYYTNTSYYNNVTLLHNDVYNCNGKENNLEDCIEASFYSCKSYAAVSCSNYMCDINSRLSCTDCLQDTCLAKSIPAAADCPQVLRCEDVCVCSDGYVRNTNKSMCIRPNDCANNCPENSYWSDGCTPVCLNQCSDYYSSTECEPVYVHKRCICNKGYVYENNRCLPSYTCQNYPGEITQCPMGSNWTDCKGSCIKSCDAIGCNSTCWQGCECSEGLLWQLGYTSCVSFDQCQSLGLSAGAQVAIAIFSILGIIALVIAAAVAIVVIIYILYRINAKKSYKQFQNQRMSDLVSEDLSPADISVVNPTYSGLSEATTTSSPYENAQNLPVGPEKEKLVGDDD